METPIASVEVFYSFAEADAPLLEQLEHHLSVLRRTKYISSWHRFQIVAGSNWRVEMDRHLSTASLILLLISSDFLASDYCYEIEMQRALERHQRGEARVIPIVLRPCDWSHAPFAHLASLPPDGVPVSLWDNRDAAWYAVSMGIYKVLEDFSPPFSLSMPLLSSRFGARFPDIWNVARRHTLFFTGRDHMLQQLVDGFCPERGVSIAPPQALTGLAGMGKTQTAAEYAYRFRGDYQAVFWVRADTQASLVVDFKAIAGMLKDVPSQVQDRVSLIRIMQEWFIRHTDWLLIFDNVNDLGLVEPFMPLASRGHILLTTRIGASTGLMQALELGPVQPEDGALCILRRANILKVHEQLSDTSTVNRDAAQLLSQKLGGLPLALEQAGAYMNDTFCGVKRYLHIYDQWRPKLQTIHSGMIHDYPEGVASTWLISRQMVERSSPAAFALLQFCAYLAPEAIPDELLSRGASVLGPVLGPVAADEVTLDQTIGLLWRNYSLINREADHETYVTRLTLHKVLQELILDEMDEPTRQLWAARAVRALALAIPQMTGNALLIHAHNCLERIAEWNISVPEAEIIQHYIKEVEEEL